MVKYQVTFEYDGFTQTYVLNSFMDARRYAAVTNGRIVKVEQQKVEQQEEDIII